MNWLMASWHKMVIALIALERIYERLEPWINRFQGIERRIGERRHATMNIPVLSQLVNLVEELFKVHAPEVVAAASNPAVQQAVEQAAVSAAVATASQDPKVQAGIAAYKALQEFKTAMNAPTQPPSATLPGTTGPQ